MNKISYKDLSGGLKALIVGLWFLVIICGLSFLIGFLQGILMLA